MPGPLSTDGELMPDYYKLLGVSKTAKLEDIRSAYKRLARDCHPDRAGVAGEEKFKQVGEAHTILSDPKKRKDYDMLIRPTTRIDPVTPCREPFLCRCTDGAERMMDAKGAAGLKRGDVVSVDGKGNGIIAGAFDEDIWWWALGSDSAELVLPWTSHAGLTRMSWRVIGHVLSEKKGTPVHSRGPSPTPSARGGPSSARACTPSANRPHQKRPPSSVADRAATLRRAGARWGYDSRPSTTTAKQPSKEPEPTSEPTPPPNSSSERPPAPPPRQHSPFHVRRSNTHTSATERRTRPGMKPASRPASPCIQAPKVPVFRNLSQTLASASPAGPGRDDNALPRTSSLRSARRPSKDPSPKPTARRVLSQSLNSARAAPTPRPNGSVQRNSEKSSVSFNHAQSATRRPPRARPPFSDSSSASSVGYSSAAVGSDADASGNKPGGQRQEPKASPPRRRSIDPVPDATLHSKTWSSIPTNFDFGETLVTPFRKLPPQRIAKPEAEAGARAEPLPQGAGSADSSPESL
eukprot:Hpha_TRINITY_DN12845_c0_g1::TRINITY_DN12845_c0_g1_i1::g.24013::m.24013